MKITPKFQKGGGFEPFFTTYVPVQIADPEDSRYRESSRRRASDSDEKGNLTEKDLFKMIGEVDGLPNEMMSLVNELSNTFRLSNLTGVDPGNLATTYLQNLYKVRILARNRTNYDKAVETAGSNGALGEPAISMDGKLIAQKPGGSLTTVDLSTYFNDPDSYSLLSVSNMAYLRAHDPSLNNDQSSIDIINNSMGYESFQKLVSQAKQSLGSSEVTRNGYFTNEGDASKGLSLLQQLSADDRVQALGSVTAEGLYEYKIIDKNQLQQINALTSYMSALLPDRAKTWAAFKLRTPDKERATKGLILQYLIASNTESHSFDISYKGTMDHVMGNKKGSSGKSGSEEEPKMTYLTAVQNGYGGRYQTRLFNPGTQGEFRVNGTVYGSFLDQEGKTVSDTNLADLLAKTGLGGITNTRSISFGDNVVNPNSLSRIAVENNGGVWAALPCVREGDVVKPNFDLIESFDKLVQEVNDELGNSATYEARQALLEKKIQNNPELQELLNMSGKLDTSKVAPFFIVDGIASDLNFNFTTRDGTPITEKSNPLISKSDDENDEQYFIRVTGSEDYDVNDSIWGDVIFGGHNNIYRSNIFIPIETNNRLAAIIFSGQKLKDSVALGIEKEYQAAGVQDMRTADSKLLFR